MKITIPPNSEGCPYFAFDFVEGKLSLLWLTKDEKNELDSQKRDAYFDLTTNKCYIFTEKRKKKEWSRGFPFGSDRWELLLSILFMTGEFKYLPSENYVYAAFARIYKVFGKQQRKKSDYWFIVDRNPSYRIRLNPVRSYLIISDSNFNGLPHDLLNIKKQ